MGVPPKIAVSDPAAQVSQDMHLNAFRELFTRPVVMGNLVTNVVLIAGSFVKVPHKLGAVYRGWSVVRKNANANVWEQAPTMPKQFIELNCSANVTVDLWVF